MAASGATITMTLREADRLKTIQAVVDRMLRVSQAAQKLGLSRRQVERLVTRYRAEGAGGLVSRKRGRPSNHQLPAGLAQRALQLIRARYPDFGATLAAEKLGERHEIWLSKETVRLLMISPVCGPRDASGRSESISRAIGAHAWANWFRSTVATTPGSRIARRLARCWSSSTMQPAD